MAIFKGFAASLKKGSQPAQTEEKKKVVLPQKKGGLFSGFASSLKAKDTPQAPVAPVTPAPAAPIPVAPAPSTGSTLGLGARKSALPVQVPVAPKPVATATGQFEKFAPLVKKTSAYLPTPKVAVDTLKAPEKDGMFAGFAKKAIAAAPLIQKSMAGPGAWFAPDLTKKSAQQTVDDTIEGFSKGVDNAKAQYTNLADKTTNFYKTAYLNPSATNAEKTAAAMDFAASLITDAGGGTFGVGLETASGFSPLFKSLKENTLDKGADLANKAGQFVGEEVVPVLPVSDKTKELIKGPVERLTTAGLMTLAFGVAGRAASKSGRTTIDVAKKLEDIKTTPLTPNEVVSSAKEALGIEGNAGQQTRTPLAEIRERFDELNRDPNITPEELQVANVAKQVLDDYARLPQIQFLDKYKPAIETVQKAAMRAPSVPGKSKPKLPVAKESAPTKITLDEANPKHFDVLEQMANAKAGIREGIQTEAGRVQTSTKSTFPKWIPENLRQKPLLDAVSKHIYDGTIPTKPNEIRLYKIASEQMGEGGLTKAYLDAERANLYDPFATAAENAKILADFDRIAEGGSAAAVKDFVRDFGKGKSKIGKSIEAKAIEKGLAESFSETAGYSKINIKDQAERASKLVANNLDDAKKMLMGDKELPDGLRAESLILALEEYALKYGDTQLALDIANSPLTSATSLHAQAMRIMAERDPDSAVAAIQKLKKMKEEAAKKTGKTKANVVKDIKESVNKVKKAKATKETWGSFIESITC